MFQTLSSFLPSPLQSNSDKTQPVAVDIAKPQETTQSEPAAMQRAEEELAVKKQKERKNERSTPTMSLRSARPISCGAEARVRAPGNGIPMTVALREIRQQGSQRPSRDQQYVPR
ncbi:uncharacterized protein B0H18DRAFT_212867 [Fomitopsis serialis]|uniref:uncharacterized protein n=1 Tax=Fomitopsis serialis TaxID=139415 RepID=UPI002007284E|nr:uncharacterized protein B0H18DRAFT_212867 [Neoantrodia serialis]KAH9929460.1 hypothetical protein B0H18DRAFT_212867 [Neoantrodia serialis]